MLVEDRLEESVHAAEVEFTPGDWPKDTKPLRFALFTMAGRIISHAGKVVLQISAAAERRVGLRAARRQLAILAAASP